MAVIREQRQFKIGPIGIARASQGGQIIGDAIARSANELTDMFYRSAAQKAEKAGIEAGSAADREAVLTINPKTGQPEAYEVPASFGSIASDAYQRVVMRRFQQGIEDEIQNKAKELAVQYENNPNAASLYETAMSDYIASMANVAEGSFKGYITDVGTTYLNSTKTNMSIAQVRRERAAAKQAQIDAVNNGLNNIESLVAQGGPNSLIGPTTTQAFIGSVKSAIQDGSDAGLVDTAEVLSMDQKTRLAVTRGLIRHAAMQTDDPEDLQMLQHAIGTQNPNAVPPQFSYVADALRGMGSDYSGLASLEKFSDGLLSDSVQYAKVVQAQEIERQNAEQSLLVFDMEQQLSAQTSAATSIASQSMPSAVAMNAVTNFSQLTSQARSQLAAGNKDVSNATIAKRDALLKSRAEGLYLQGLSGLSTADTQKLEQAIFERNPSLAPASSRPAVSALMRMQEQTGVPVLDDFLPEIGSYREAAGKATDLQIKSNAAAQAAGVDIRGVAFAPDAKKAAEDALGELAKINGLDPALRTTYENQIVFNAGKNSLNKFFSTMPSEAQIREAKSLMEDGAITEGVLTKPQADMLMAARDAANQSGKQSEMRTLFNSQNDVASQRRKEMQKAADDQLLLSNIKMGMGTATNQDHRVLVEKYMEERVADALNGRPLSSLWSDPEAFSNPNFAPIFDELTKMNVMPESLHRAFTSLARGAWAGGNPNVLLSHYQNFRSYQYQSVEMTNPMMEALTQEEQVMLDYMADSMLVFGNQSPDRIAEIFKVKQQYEEDPQLKSRVETFLGSSLEEYVMSLDGMDSAPPSAFNAMSSAALNLFTTSRSSGLSLGEMTSRLEGQVERSFPDGSGIVFGPGFSKRTSLPISKAAPGNEHLFREHILSKVTASNPGITPIFGAPSKIESFFVGDTDYIYLQPLDSDSTGRVSYIVKQRLPAEMGGDRVLQETVESDGRMISVPLIVSNRDESFMEMVTSRKSREEKEAIEEGRRILQGKEELMKKSFSEIEGLQ